MQKFEYYLVGFLSLLVLALSFYPIYYRYKTTPPDRVYVGTTYYTPDYAGYVSTIEQGIKGRWTYSDKFTTEKLPETFLYYPYLLLGHIGGLFGLTSVWIYHLSRLIFGAVYLGLIYWLIRLVFPYPSVIARSPKVTVAILNKKEDSHVVPTSSGLLGMTLRRLTAFILVLFSSSWPVITGGGINVGSLSRTIAETQVVNRFVIQPHFLLGNIFLILGLILFLKYLEKPLLKYAIISGFLALLISMFRPSHVMIYTATIVLFSLLRWNLNKRELRFHLITIIFSAPGFLYLWYLRQNFPQLPYFGYDFIKSINYGIWDWILLQGPILVLALTFLKFFSFKKDKKNLILYSFIVVNFLLYFLLSRIFAFNQLRFLQTPLFVVLAILATEAVFRLTKNLSLIALIFLIPLIASLPTTWLDFDHEVNLYYDAYYIWPPKGYFPGLKFLETNSQPEDVVLTYQSLSNLVPMLSGNRVYWGHSNETLEYTKKQERVESFYKGEMKENEALDFLQKNKIKFVLVGREERALGSFKYTFLKKDFANTELEIYNTKL